MSRGPRPLDVAIVGMACRFAGAPDLFAFWEDVLAARPSIRDVPPGRWDADLFCDPDSSDPDRVSGRRGGYLAEPILLDATALGVMPRTVEGGEPEQFLVLDAALSALRDAGLGGGVPDGSRVEVVIGRGNYFNRGNLTRLQHGRVLAQTLAILRALHPEWTEAELDAVREDLRSSLPPFESATIPGQLTNATAGRVAHRLGLGGTSLVVDAASASALVALDLGARSLASRRADLAIVGGVYAEADVDFPMVFSRLGILSRSGVPRPYSEEADGLVPGEGVGVVVLKRLADAERDGDRIYAVLKGVGLASDGRGPGLSSPSARGHVRAIRRAYRRSGVDPASIGLIEGHGLGIPAADRAELLALRAVFPPAGPGEGRVLGASSALVGHAMPAAGMAGLIKAALSLHHRALPASGGTGRPHPRLSRSGGRFELNPVTRPWVGGGPSPRRAGVNAFGFAGINAHAILEEHPSSDGDTPGALLRWPDEAILLGADDRRSLADRARRIADRLRGRPDLELKDLAATLNGQAVRSGAPARLGLVARSIADLIDRLESAARRLDEPGRAAIRDARGTYYWERSSGMPGGLAFLFPGEGSQYPGMLADLCLHFPEVRALFDRIDRMARESGSIAPPASRLYRAGPDGDPGLWEAGTAVHVVLASQWALYQLLMRLGLRPDAVCGHSSGEFPALVASGAIPEDDRLEHRLGELAAVFAGLERSGRIPEALLLGVACDRARVEAELGGEAGSVAIAADNCPHQVVLVGPFDAVRAVEARLRASGVATEDLPFARAYHSPAFAPAVGPIRSFFDTLEVGPPSVPVYSCCTAGRMPGDAEEVRRLAVSQWTRPVEFRGTVEAMHADGIRVFVDVGARGNLAGFVEDSLRGRDAFAVAANLPRRSGLTQLNHLVASLFARGLALDPGVLYARRRPALVDLDADPAPLPVTVPLRLDFPAMILSDRLASRLGARASADVRESIAMAGPTPPDRLEGSGEPEEEPIRQPSRRSLREAARAGGRSPGSGLVSRDDSPWSEAEAPAVATLPLLSTADLEPARGHSTGGGPIVSSIVLEATGDPVAEHHTFGGRRISEVDPDLKGLPVLPFTVMAEMLADAAARLRPGEALVGLRDVRARRWIRYEADPIRLDVAVEPDPDRPGEVLALLSNRGPAGGEPIDRDQSEVEAVALFAPTRREPPDPMPFDLGPDAEPSRFTAESMYGEQWLFHGPALRAVVGVGSVSDRGIEGTIRVLPRRALRRKPDDPRPITDPIVLDAFTHLLGLWGLERLAEGDVLFPLRLGELAIFGDDPPEGTDVSCRIVIKEVDRLRVRVDAELVRPDGLVWMRLTDWEDWRFYWPPRYRDVFRMPNRVLVGEPLDLPGAPPDAVAVWLQPPLDMGRPIWRDVLEQIQLSPEERAGCLRPVGPEERRTLRLWGRIAAKEAARRLWLAEGGPAVYPADLTIEPDPTGRPRLRSRLEPERDDLPAVSIAHTEGVAVGLSCRDPFAFVGIDVEPIVPRSPSFEDLAFSPAERSLLDRFPREDRAGWIARLWCAKEALGKATGLGMIAGPSSVAVVDVDPDSGRLAALLGPDLESRCPGLAGGPIAVGSAIRGEYVYAWVVMGSDRR
ncbi:type I polyketide synthase [Tautonia sociabilis]|nr:type I polyketide synthase [Tautonia sociabilis]